MASLKYETYSAESDVYIMIRRMATESEEIAKALKSVVDNINRAVQHRPQSLPATQVRLVAVTKTKPVSAIIAAYQQGQRHFGENYVLELEEKSKNLKIQEQCKDIRWHFIGHLQRNKSGKIAAVPNLYMVETVDSQKLAQTLNNHWEKYNRPGKLHIMVQVNTSLEENKSGCERSEMCPLVKYIREKCPCLQFMGLMTIGAFGYNLEDGPNPDFLRLVECREELCRELNLQLEEVELSMGMSSDYEHAIQLGSTNVRVGSTIFGTREYGPKPTTTTSPTPAGDGQSNIGAQPQSVDSQSNSRGAQPPSGERQSKSTEAQPPCSDSQSNSGGAQTADSSKDDSNNAIRDSDFSSQHLSSSVNRLNICDNT